MRLAYSLLHDEDEARDVVQEVFLRIWESDVRIASPAAFILKSVRNACLSRLSRMEAHDRVHRRLLLEMPPDDTDIEEQHRRVRLAIEQVLTVRQQEVVEKIYTEGLSYKETARDLNVSVSAVNKNMVAALKKLRLHFKEHIL